MNNNCALGDFVPFLERSLDQVPRDAGPDVDGVDRFDATRVFDVVGHLSHDRLADRDRRGLGGAICGVRFSHPPPGIRPLSKRTVAMRLAAKIAGHRCPSGLAVRFHCPAAKNLRTSSSCEPSRADQHAVALRSFAMARILPAIPLTATRPKNSP